MCVACYVDEAMKQKIIAYNAEFHQVARSPYGKDDEIGMLNLIDAQSRSAFLGRADPSKVFDLSVDNFVGMPGWFDAGDQPYQIWLTHTPAGKLLPTRWAPAWRPTRWLVIPAMASRCIPTAAPYRHAQPFWLSRKDLQRLQR